MTQQQQTRATGTTVYEPDRQGRPAQAQDETRSRPWWRRSWMVPLGIVVVAFLGYTLPPYLTLEESQARPPGLDTDRYPPHYAFLVAHIAFGTVAMVLVCLQVWPRLRLNHPKAHRVMGRIAIFGGVLPAAIMALAIMPFSGGPPGDAVAGLLWLATTIYGFRMVRTGRFAEHRRFMIYAFALTMQIIWGRVFFFAAAGITGFEEDKLGLIGNTSTWIGVVINLAIAQWWIERTANRPVQLSARAERKRVTA